MADIRLQAKLAKIGVAPEKDGGDPIITITLVPEYSDDLTKLIPHVGKPVFLTIGARQIEMALAGR